MIQMRLSQRSASRCCLRAPNISGSEAFLSLFMLALWLTPQATLITIFSDLSSQENDNPEEELTSSSARFLAMSSVRFPPHLTMGLIGSCVCVACNSDMIAAVVSKCEPLGLPSFFSASNLVGVSMRSP